jgi:hypothetical protein
MLEMRRAVRDMKRVSSVAVLSAQAILSLGTSVAQAEGPAEVLTTTFSGTTGFNGVLPAIPPPPAGRGQTGTYTFAGNVPGTLPSGSAGACLLVDPTAPTETTACSGTITSAGTYQNLVCGTGTVDGDATVSGTPAAESPFKVVYDIDFVAGVGVLEIRSGSHADGTGALGGGYVLLTQLPGENCATTGATGFNLSGGMSISFLE